MAVPPERTLHPSYGKPEHPVSPSAETIKTQVPSSEGSASMDFQKFLDTQQYTTRGILRYERVFGDGFVSPGGLETTTEFVGMLDLKAGQRVLDVGCGIGGSAFYMAEEFEAEVIGIDLSVNMISLARERSVARKSGGVTEFQVEDCTTVEYPDASFDAVYTRDTLLHIQDKPALFDRFHKWLKPGGRVLITYYCRAPSVPSLEFAAYVQQRGYALHSVHAYGQMLQAAGFVDVVAEDRTDQFMGILKKELAATEKARYKFIEDFSEDDYKHIVSGWESKLKRCSDGEQKWGLFLAHKPLQEPRL